MAGAKTSVPRFGVEPKAIRTRGWQSRKHCAVAGTSKSSGMDKLELA